MKNTLIIIGLALGIVSCTETQKTGYVNNTRVVQEFGLMKEAEAKWTAKNNEVRTELEKKAADFQKEVQEFQASFDKLSKNDKEKKSAELSNKQQSLQREQQFRAQEIQQGSGVEIDSIVSQVKNYIKEYGKKNGYTYIYGDTEASNLLYAKEDLDLTDEIIKKLNEEFPSTTTPSDSTETNNANSNDTTAVQE